jgi:HSP20 family molecular chaperone IbpA
MSNGLIVPTVLDMWDAPFMDPFRTELFSVGKRMNDWAKEVNQNALQWSRMNYYSSATEYIYEFTVPGMTKDDIRVSITNQNELNINSVSTIESEEIIKGYHHQEFSRHKFSRKVALQEDAITNEGSIKANVVDGILTIIFKRIVPENNGTNSTNVVVN